MSGCIDLNGTSVGLCRGRGSMLKSPWMGSMVLSSTLNRKKINPYRAGPRPLHSPLMPVIIPWTTPVGHITGHVTGDMSNVAAITASADIFSWQWTDFTAGFGNPNSSSGKNHDDILTYRSEEGKKRDEEWGVGGGW